MQQPGLQQSQEQIRQAALFALQNLGNNLPGINQWNTWEKYTSRDTLSLSNQIRLAKQDVTNAKAQQQEVINRVIDRHAEEALEHDLQWYRRADPYQRDDPAVKSSSEAEQDAAAKKNYEKLLDEEILKSTNALHTSQIDLLIRTKQAHKATITTLQARVKELEAQAEAQNHRARKALPRTMEEYFRLQELDMQMALEVGKYLQGNADTRNALMKKYEVELAWNQEDADALIRAYDEQVELRHRVRTLVQAKSNSVDPRNR